MANPYSPKKLLLHWEENIKEMTHFVKFNLNINQRGYINPLRTGKLIERFHKELDKKLYPSNSSLKTKFRGFIENPDDNLAYHGFVTTSDIARFNELAPIVWKKLIPSGTLEIEQKPFKKADIKRIAAYIVKHLKYGHNVFIGYPPHD